MKRGREEEKQDDADDLDYSDHVNPYLELIGREQKTLPRIIKLDKLTDLGRLPCGDGLKVKIDSHEYPCSVSKNQARISFDADSEKWILKDGGFDNATNKWKASSSGTFVNNIRISEKSLSHGDVIAFSSKGGPKAKLDAHFNVETDVLYRFVHDYEALENKKRRIQEEKHRKVAEELEKKLQEQESRNKLLEEERKKKEEEFVRATEEEKAKIEQELKKKEEDYLKTIEEKKKLEEKLNASETANLLQNESKEVILKLGENLMCQICSSYMVDPVNTLCGHSFCGMCWFDWKEDQAAKKKDVVSRTDMLNGKLSPMLTIGSTDRQTCMVCRAIITTNPAPNLGIRDAILAILPQMSKEDREDYLAKQQEVEEKKKKEYETMKRHIQTEKGKGASFLYICDVWTEASKELFAKCIKQCRFPKTRELFCESIGLTKTWISKAKRFELQRASLNLRLSIPPSASEDFIKGNLTSYLTTT